MTPRENILAGLVFVALLGTAAWSYSALAESHARAAAQATRTADAAALAQKISKLRAASPSASSPTGNSPLSQRLTEAAEAAGCSAALERIEPESPRSVGEAGKLQEIPTRVQLGKVTLAQGLQFIRAVEAADPAIRATTLHWTAAPGDLWSANIVFSRLEPAP